jgi:hypothetical protein
MRHILVLQWLGTSEADYEALLEMEDELENSPSDHLSVDGHDFGSGEMNIFIETDNPALAFADAEAILGGRPRWAEVRAAHRGETGETYTVLRPAGQTDFAVA